MDERSSQEVFEDKLKDAIDGVLEKRFDSCTYLFYHSKLFIYLMISSLKFERAYEQYQIHHSSIKEESAHRVLTRKVSDCIRCFGALFEERLVDCNYDHSVLTLSNWYESFTDI